MTNSVDHDQMLHSASSDLGLHCFKGLSVPILRIIMVGTIRYFFSLYIFCLHFLIKQQINFYSRAAPRVSLAYIFSLFFFLESKCSLYLNMQPHYIRDQDSYFTLDNYMKTLFFFFFFFFFLICWDEVMYLCWPHLNNLRVGTLYHYFC